MINIIFPAIGSMILMTIIGCATHTDWEKIGSLPAIQKELEKGTPVNELRKIKYSRVTLLHLAIIAGDPDSVRLLIENGADVNLKHDDASPLHLATRNNRARIEIVKSLLQAGADIQNSAGLLENVIRNRNLVKTDKLNFLKVLIGAGADVNARDRFGDAPLHCVSDIDILKLLVGNGADITIRDNDGQTPLSYAINKKYIQAACYLAELAAKENSQYPDYQENPLYMAVKKGNWDMVRCFIESGHTVNIGTIHDNLLSLAAGYRQGNAHFIPGGFDKKAFWFLVELGIDIKKFGGPCLTSLSNWDKLTDDWPRRRELFQFLIDKGVNVNYYKRKVNFTYNNQKIGSVRESPLYWLLRSYRTDLDTVKYLIENGAEVTPALKKLFRIRFPNIAAKHISDWRLAGLKKIRDRKLSALDALEPAYLKELGKLKSMKAHLLLEAEYQTITERWAELGNAAYSDYKNWSVDAINEEGRRIVADLSGLGQTFPSEFKFRFSTAAKTLGGVKKQFASINFNDARTYAGQAYSRLNASLIELSKQMEKMPIEPNPQMVIVILECEQIDSQLQSLTAQMERQKSRINLARLTYRNAAVAMEQIPSSKALIHSPGEYKSAQAKLKKVRQILDSSKPIDTKNIELAATASKEALQLIQYMDRKINLAQTRTDNLESNQNRHAHQNLKLPNRSKTAVIIGLDKYQEFPSLKNAVNDARAVAKSLREHYGFKLIEMYNEKATRENIYKTLRSIVAATREGDSILLYYAGHGLEDEILKEGYWVPFDGRQNRTSSFIGNAELHRIIKSMEKAQHVLLIADSCFSGTFLSRSTSQRGIFLNATKKEKLNYFKKVDNRKSRIVLTSGSLEPVPDGGRQGHSIFGYYLLRAFEAPDDPVFTSSDLINRVTQSVSNNSPQSPLAGELRGTGHENGLMVFISNTE